MKASSLLWILLVISVLLVWLPRDGDILHCVGICLMVVVLVLFLLIRKPSLIEKSNEKKVEDKTSEDNDVQ